MKRIQLFEFEDFAWLPDEIRSSMTRLIVVIHRLMDTKSVLIELLESIRARHPFEQIVDMGSGSGGIMPAVVADLNANSPSPTRLVLTDLHPSATYRATIAQQGNPHLHYQEAPLDATQLQTAPEGLKTMICSFHHLPPEAAQQVLRSAQASRQPLLIYEISENKIPLLVWWLFLPLALVITSITALFFTPFTRPLTWRQLLFTYVIPVVPLLYAWDGQASYVRTYSTEDVYELIGPMVEDYNWTITPVSKGRAMGYAILGMPV